MLNHHLDNSLLAVGSERTNNMCVVVWSIIGNKHHCFAGMILVFKRRVNLVFHLQHEGVAVYIIMIVASMRLGGPQGCTG
jgi:hypothetical protein